MSARKPSLGAALLAVSALVLLSSNAWAQRADSQDFCAMIDLGQLTVTAARVGDSAVVTFTTPTDVAEVQRQVHNLAARANAPRLEGLDPPPSEGGWMIAVPPASAFVSEQADGAVLILTNTQAFGTAMLQAWAGHVQQMILQGNCRQLLEPVGAEV